MTLLAGTVLLAGCNTTGSMHIPKPAAGPAQPASISVPTEEQASFALTKVVANIKRGTTIAHFPAFGAGFGGRLCAARQAGNSTVEWGSGSTYLGGWRDELGEIFFDVMSDTGLNIAGDPKQLFEQENAVRSADYSVGARIRQIRGNFCEDRNFWSGLPTRTYLGEMFVDVEWTIYANLQKRRVLKLETQGYYKLSQPKKNGFIVAFQEAFARAAERLASLQKFSDLAARAERRTSVATKSFEPIAIARTKPSTTEIGTNLDGVLSAVVTVRVGRGHGSGFLISTDGLILTNHHVVGSSKTVTIVLNNGLEVVGEVLRFDKLRDVALVKAPIRIRAALPLRRKIANPLEKVFVIGTPADESLQSTVTAGIVSAVRYDEKSGLKLIQSDAPITGGNSGGPLLDAHGNVIGMSVATLQGANNINLFIPIGEALEKLGIDVSPDKAS